jgi:hypothetical protein
VFDQGFATIADDGSVLLSEFLSNADRTKLGIEGRLRVDRLKDAHRRYLQFHREGVFRKS